MAGISNSRDAQSLRFEAAISAEVFSKLWRYAARLSLSREDAEDLLQDTLTNGYLKFDQLKDPLKLLSWLLSIMHSRFLNQIRAQKRYADHQSQLRLPANTNKPDSDTLEVQAALYALSTEHRLLLTMYYIEGSSIPQVADVLGVRQGAARQRLLRARHALKAQLANQMRLNFPVRAQDAVAVLLRRHR